MRDDTMTPYQPESDPGLDHDLAALERFTPKPGFESRVLDSVRHPLPAWARRTRDTLRWMVTGVRGWVILGCCSAATAATVALAVGAAVRFSDYTSRGGELVLSEVIEPASRGAVAVGTELANELSTSVLGALGTAGIPWQGFAIAYVVLVGVSALALRILTRPPQRRFDA